MKFTFGLFTVNISNINTKTSTDVSLLQIRHLCERKDNKQIEVKFFELPSVLEQVLSPLHNVQKSTTFQKLWTQYGTKAQRARKNDERKIPQLSISDVVGNIWKPAFNDWNKHVTGIVDGTVTLGDVDKLFESYTETREKELESELTGMFQQSQSHSVTSSKHLRGVIGERIAQIQRYQQLCQYFNAAVTIWEFKEAMGFTGDFKVIQDLLSQVFSV